MEYCPVKEPTDTIFNARNFIYDCSQGGGKGPTGSQGTTGPTGSQGTTGYTGATGLAGVPSGGTTNQLLMKSSNSDYDTQWSSVINATSASLSSFVDAPALMTTRYEIKVGRETGLVSQGSNAVAVGAIAGFNTQGSGAVAVGVGAGYTNQGADAVAVGKYAGYTNQHTRTIVLNSTGATMDTDRTDALFVAPIRNTGTDQGLFYNPSTKEVSYDVFTGGATGPTGMTGNVGPQGPAGTTNVVTTQDSVGSYAFCKAALALQFGSTVAGSNLIPCAADGTSGSTTSLSGTWRCMGRITGTPPSTYGSPTLFVRIS